MFIFLKSNNNSDLVCKYTCGKLREIWTEQPIFVNFLPRALFKTRNDYKQTNFLSAADVENEKDCIYIKFSCVRYPTGKSISYPSL